jgi:hypothetical protein
MKTKQAAFFTFSFIIIIFACVAQDGVITLSIDDIIDGNKQHYGKYSDPDETLKSGNFDVIYRFAVSDHIPKLNSYDMYFVLAYMSDKENSGCEVYVKYISNDKILKESSFLLNEGPTEVIDYCEVFNLTPIIIGNPATWSTNSFTAQRIDSNGSKSIIRTFEDSLPAKYLIEYLMEMTEVYTEKQSSVSTVPPTPSSEDK